MKREPEDNGESWQSDLIFGISIMLALLAPLITLLIWNS